MRKLLTLFILISIATSLFAQNSRQENRKHADFKKPLEKVRTDKNLFKKEDLSMLELKKSTFSVIANVQDSLALVALYNSTNGTNWRYRTNWLTDNVITWIGISLDSISGKVIEINLSNNRLSGTLPKEIGNLTSLETLSLSANQLSGSIPKEIGDLSNLKWLMLSDNYQINGNIPKEIGNLTSLIGLSLSNNQFSGNIPMEIGKLTNLEWLHLDNNQLTGSIPKEIGNLTSLTHFICNLNQINDSIPKEIGNLTSLRYLTLSYNQLRGNIPKEIGNLTSLLQLNLEYNQLSDNIPIEIGGLTNLEWLHLYNNQLTGNVPKEIGNLTNLTSLIFSNNQLSGNIPNEIGNLTSLTSLILYDNKFENLPDLSSLIEMNSLSIKNNKFTFEDIEPNINVAQYTFNYTPQAKVGSVQQYLPNTESTLSLEVEVDGSANSYQWYKNNIAITGATDSLYTISSYNSAIDSGIYTCNINNTIATALTIESYNIYVGVDVSTFQIIATTTPNGGYVSGAGTYNDGDIAKLTATPNIGYHFIYWTENNTIVTSDTTISFTVDSERNFIANFEIATFDISSTINPVDGGTISGDAMYDYGTIAELTATPYIGYQFVNWTENDTIVSSDTTISFTVDSERNFIANFEIATFDISSTINPVDGGTISGDAMYDYGTIAELTATPYIGYQFVNWTENDTIVSINSTISFTVDSERIFVANFEIQTFNISATANPIDGGSISGAAIYDYETIAELTATPYTGYDFINWTENDTIVSSDTTINFAVDAERIFVANFEVATSISNLENMVIEVYPNPVSNELIVELESSITDAINIRLINIKGNVIKKKTFYNNHICKLNVSNLNAGAYFLHIKYTDNSIVKKVIIK